MCLEVTSLIFYIFNVIYYKNYWSALNYLSFHIYNIHFWESCFFTDWKRQRSTKMGPQIGWPRFQNVYPIFFWVCKVYFNKLTWFGLSTFNFLQHHQLGTGLKSIFSDKTNFIFFFKKALYLRKLEYTHINNPEAKDKTCLAHFLALQSRTQSQSTEVTHHQSSKEKTSKFC